MFFFILVLLFGPELSHGSQFGAIDPKTNVIAVVKDAYEDARFLCEQYYLSAPELRIDVQNKGTHLHASKKCPYRFKIFARQT